MSKHTLTPWLVRLANDGTRRAVSLNSSNGILCSFHQQFWKRHREEADANVALFLASPLMLKTLETVLEFYDNSEKYPVVPMGEIRNLVQTAIEFARGEK